MYDHDAQMIVIPVEERMNVILNRYCQALRELIKSPNPEALEINEKFHVAVTSFYYVLKEYVSQMERSLNITDCSEVPTHE